MDRFEREYKNLNVRQKEAVDYINGPLLVVAGPGTGKTQLLSMRVANILKQTDTAPQNILCLTYTNKAALNMKERLLKLTNNGAKDVMVKTFHSFSAEIINLFPEYFWNGARLSIAPDTVQNEVILTILESLPLDNPLALKFIGQFTNGNEVKSALKLVKEAGLTPDKLSALIKANLAYLDIIEPKLVDILSQSLSFKRLDDIQQQILQLPKQYIDISLSPLTSLTTVIQDGLEFAIQQDNLINKTTNTGKWKQNLIQSRDGKKGMYKERERNNWWLSLAQVYELYRLELHRRGFYDYADMLVEVISVMEQDAGLRADIQERFLYVLIDEFQDSNAAQMRLAHLITNNAVNFGKPNLMVVGDDDQSIYKFNGAELANMLTFKKNYPDTKLIVLTDNYRSSQEVLDASSKIIEKANDRLVYRDPSINKQLVAKNPPKTNSTILNKVYQNQDFQLDDVAREISNLYSNKQHSIAVLARNKGSLLKVASYLVDLDVPISYQEQNNILEHQLVITIHQIASLLLAIIDGDIINVNYLLSHILRHQMWKIDPYDLWQLASENQKSNWLSVMANKPQEHIFYKIQQWLLWLTTKVSIEPLFVITEYITGLRPSQHLTSPLRDYYINKTAIDTDYLHGLSALRLILSLVDDFSLLSNGSLQDFVAFINTARETGQIIADETTFVTSDDAVELLTIHKAKGLEFDIVFIIDAIDSNWRPRTANKRSPINLPLQPVFDDSDDYIRLMYVAVTRARHTVIVTSYKNNEKGQLISTTPIIENILPEKVIQIDDNTKKIMVLEQALSWPKLSNNQERNFLKPRLENFQLSATALIDFLDIVNCGPEKFKEHYLLRLPSTQTSQMAFGKAMHNALELAQILVNKNIFDIKILIDHFELKLNQQNLPNNDKIRFLKYGVSLIEKLFNNDYFKLPQHGMPEQNISDIILGDARLSGKLDRIETEDDTILITDYKTGKPMSSFFTKDQTKMTRAWKYRTQLNFYCLLAKNSSKFNKYKHYKGQLIFLEASSPKELIKEYTPNADELVKLEKLILIIWRKIMSLDFPDTSEYPKSFDGIQQFESNLLQEK